MARKARHGGAGELASTSAEQAKQRFLETADSLVKRYAANGLIDKRTRDFANEYRDAAYEIVQPLLLANDVDAVAEHAIARLWQAKQFYVYDEGEFSDREISAVEVLMDWAFAHGDDAQRGRLFALLADYLMEELDDRGEWINALERNLIEDFIGDVYATEPRFATDVVELADRCLEGLPAFTVDEAGRVVTEDPDAGYRWYGGSFEIEHAHLAWALTRMTAMSTRGDSVDELYVYAEEHGLLDYTEALLLIANAYMLLGDPRKAISILREHMDATDMYNTSDGEHVHLQLVDYVLAIAFTCYSKVEMIDLYCNLLLDESNTATFSWYGREEREEIVRWYDELRGMVRTPDWDMMRVNLLSLVSDKRREVLLNHEKNVRAFHRQMIHTLNEGFSVADQYEEDSSGTGPLFAATYYIRYAELLMERANTRKDYRTVATALAYAASLCDQFNLAQEAAGKIAATHPGKKALHEELRKGGFIV
ncbi:MAG: hypothetical protein Q4B54_05715 [Coriobacteriales bacterium]|nr:hypothetical protein [Coriobacteriales bacterium]